MKLIRAVIKPFKLEEVKEALTAIGVAGMTVTETKGFGQQKSHAETHPGSDYPPNFLPKLKVEVAVGDEIADRVVLALVAAARTGKLGDGKVFVLPLEQALRVRTGERGEAAL